MQALPYVVVVMAFFMVRIVRIFTQHQQKMAEILNRTQADQTEIASLRREMAEMKALLHDQIIRHDASVSNPPPVPELTDRLRTQA